MERWRGRVAVVTGASAGIGAAIAYQLQDAGVHVVGLARRSEKIQEAVESARQEAKSRKKGQFGQAPSPGKLHCLKCDLGKEEEIVAAFQWVKENTDGVDILVNNAGVGAVAQLTGTEKEISKWKSILDINVLGLSICTREAVQEMKARGVNGHIVHISSVAGHWLPPSTWPGWGMYFASKHAVRVLTEGLRKELVAAKTKIRVTEVSPGLVKTDIFNNMENLKPEDVFKMPHIFPEDIADAVLYAIQVPETVQIHEIIIKPTEEDF